MRLVRLLLVCAAVCGLSVPAAAQLVANTAQGGPFEFPIGGTTVMARQPGYAIGANSFVTLDSIPTGQSGVIRAIMLQNVGEDTTGVFDMYLTLRYDGRMTGAADDSFPLAELFAYYNLGHKMADTLHTFETPYWARLTAWSSVKTAQEFAWVDRYPKPFTNGLVVRLYARTASHTVWTSVFRQTSLPACWNRTLRFHVARIDSTVAASGSIPGSGGTPNVQISSADVVTGTHTTFTTNHKGWALVGDGWAKELIIKAFTSASSVTIFPSDHNSVRDFGAYGAPGSDDPIFGRPCVFFRRPAGKTGYVCSTVMAMNSTDQTTFEACPRWYLNSPNAGSDGIDATLIGSGFEDWFGGVNYHFMGFQGSGPSGIAANGRLVGCTALNNDASTGKVRFTGYRILEYPLPYTNGASATWFNYATSTTRLRAFVVYYEKQ